MEEKRDSKRYDADSASHKGSKPYPMWRNVLLMLPFSTWSRESGDGLGAGKYVMLGRMIRGLPLLIILVFSPVSSAESVQVITADDWARPRSGESLVQMPALQRTVRDFLSQSDERGRRILIRHPRGEEGVLWAEELRSWLVALGIPSAAIAVTPASTRIDSIELAVLGADN
jgi:hypothetical protein